MNPINLNLLLRRQQELATRAGRGRQIWLLKTPWVKDFGLVGPTQAL